MRPVLAIALTLALAPVGCKKGPAAGAAGAAASPTTFEWSQASPDGRFELRQRREASGCSVQAVERGDGKQLWSSRTCLPAPSGLFFLSPAADRLLVLDLFPVAEGHSQDWSKVKLAALWTAGAVSRQYTGAELLSRDRISDMRSALSWVRGESYDEVRAAARTVAGGTQVSVDLADGRTILLGFDGAALPTPPARSPRTVAALPPEPEPVAPPPAETTRPTPPAAGEVAIDMESDARMFRWEDERGELHFAPGADVPARYRKRAVPVGGNVGVVSLEKVGAAPAPAPAPAPASGSPAGGAPEAAAPAGSPPPAVPREQSGR